MVATIWRRTAQDKQFWKDLGEPFAWKWALFPKILSRIILNKIKSFLNSILLTFKFLFSLEEFCIFSNQIFIMYLHEIEIKAYLFINGYIFVKVFIIIY